MSKRTYKKNTWKHFNKDLQEEYLEACQKGPTRRILGSMSKRTYKKNTWKHVKKDLQEEYLEACQKGPTRRIL